MSYRFIKLSCDITKSTIWAEDDATLRLWIWLMASADRHGFIGGTIPGIASAARIAMDACERVLVKFEGPDKYSSNPSNEGRRVEKVEGGWRLLNYSYYRDRKGGDSEWQAERNRTKVAAFRDRQRQKKAEPVTGQCNRVPVTVGNKAADVTDLLPGVTTEAEAEAEADVSSSGKEAESTKPSVGVEPTVARQEPSDDVPKQPEAKVSPVDPIDAIYQAYPRKVGPRKAKEAIERAMERIMAGERGEKEPQRLVALRWLYAVVKEYAQSPTGNRGTLTPHPTTWFNQSRYLDDPKEWQRQEEAHGFVKQSVTPGNLAACDAVIQRLNEGRSDPQIAGVAGELLRAPDSAGDVRRLPVGAPGTHDGAVGGRIQPSSAAVQILPPAGRTASPGRMPDRRPTF